MNEKYYIKDAKYKSDEKYGYMPHQRPIEDLLNNSIIILDKPSGPNSHQVAGWVKDILGVKKAGHGGTLDPKVTGVLPIMVGKAAKLTQYILSQDKEYIVLMKLHQKVDEKKINEELKKLSGTIEQTPPVKSAVKRKKRKRKVHHIEILEIEGKYVLFKAKVQAGTYIRKLCHDFGKRLGVGANMQELRRISSGTYTEEHAVYLQKIGEAYHLYKEKKDEEKIREILLPVETAIKNLKKIYVKDGAAGALTYGAPLYAKGVVMVEKSITPGEKVALLTMKGELIGMGKAIKSANDIKKLNKGIVAMPDTIIMDKDVYPKSWKK